MEKLLQPLREQGMIDDKSLGSAPKKPRLSNGATFDIFSANPDNGTTSSLSSSDRVYTSPPSSKNLSNLENYNTYQNPIEQTNVWEQPQLNIHNGQLSPSDDVSVDNSKIIDESDDNNSTCQEGHKGDLLFFGKTSAHPGFRRLGECTPPEEGNLSANETSLPNVAQSGIFNASMFQALPYPFAFPRGDSYPPSDIIDHLSLCFFNHMINHTPMFHEPTLRFRLRTRKASPFLVWALCAVAARYSDLPGIAKDPPHSAGDVFAERAISYMAESFDDPNVENVQAILLLCLHSFGSAKGPRSWMYIAMAVRMAQALGMHKEFADVSCMYAKKGNSHQAFIYREIRRRVFWVCFVIDRFSACALGRPTIIDEGDVEIRQPCDDREWRKEHPAISDMMDDRPAESPVKRGRRFILSTSGVFSSLTSVSILLGRVAQYINRMRSADALPVWDSKSEFAQLENQLESWYESLSQELKWSPEMLKYHVGNGKIGAYAAILTLYHVSIVVLNRPNVATLQTGTAPESQLAFFHISADKCITSARRTAKIAEALLEAKCTNLCPFTLYPIFATATMHINDTFSNDKNVVEIAHKNLNITERYLEMVRPYWNIAGKLIHMLKQMRKCRTEDIMCPESTDSGLMEYWNRAHASSKPSSKPDTSFQDVMSDSSLVGLSSFVTPEFLSPRFMTTELPDPWVNFIRSPGIISPRSLVRLSRRDPVDDNTVYNNQDDYFAQDMTLYNVVNNQFAYEGLTDPLAATSLTDLSTTRLYRTPSLFRQLVDQQGLGGGALKEITTANGTNLSAGLASPVIDSLDADFYDNSNLEGEDSRNDNRDKHILPVAL
ncbi:4271_t:CDS:2 [Paraglomus occultum]|uniref:4271_t:CDS:1 n=1 Tax=Paraglomus occultum TaxID=144539 RepID=A0A9N9FLA7_9GLOM|nr:4271_t:CDS:2 [Paraglomus occultum]